MPVSMALCCSRSIETLRLAALQGHYDPLLTKNILIATVVNLNNRRKFRSQTSDVMGRRKAEMGRVREMRRIEEGRWEKRKGQKKEDADARKGRKVAKHCVFPMIWGSGSRKVGSLKRRVRSHLARWEMKKSALLWREAHFEVKMYKTHHVRSTLGSWDVEKVRAVVAWSTFPSQNAQNTPGSDHFWKLRCWKSARRCGAKHISKSKCTKHTMFDPLLEIVMSKKWTPLWRGAHVEVKMYKTHQVRTTFGSWDVEKVHAIVARSTFRSQNVKNTRGSDHFWRFRRRFAWQAQGIVHLVKSEQNLRVLYHFQLQPPLHHTTLQYTTLQLQLHLHYIPLHYTTPHSTTFHYTALNYTQLHCAAQGGGRSFKNMKPIWEVGCCESRMAERSHWWTKRWLELCFLDWLQWLQWSPHHNCCM